MRVPSAHIFYKFTQHVAFFIIGMLFGALIFLFMYGKIIDQKDIVNRKMQSELTELKQELDTLKGKEEEYKNSRKLIINKISIEVIKDEKKPLSEITESEIIDRLRHDLKFLIGMPLESVADTSTALHHFINGRKYTLDQQEISLELSTLVIYTNMQFKIKVTKL